MIYAPNQEEKKALAYGIIDSQSVKNIGTAQEKGYDEGKKISCIQTPYSS